VTVAVIVPTFNQARFLGDALASVIAQTRPADEIVVVDDGSTDNPAAIAKNFPSVLFIRQENRGLSATRNTGLRKCTASHVVFLDADDRLLPVALEAGLNHAVLNADCAFVCGGFHLISEDGSWRGPDHRPAPLEGDVHTQFLHGNLIGMGATVLYRRECLTELGGFDEMLYGCQDYDLYLRITRRYGVASHPAIVAEYRAHGQNMSRNHRVGLREALVVLDRHERRIVPSASELAALQVGRKNWRAFYASKMLQTAIARGISLEALGLLVQALKSSPRTVVRWAWSRCGALCKGAKGLVFPRT
jgi:glycosyltransferase involved in cell wall biosynthesis